MGNTVTLTAFVNFGGDDFLGTLYSFGVVPASSSAKGVFASVDAAFKKFSEGGFIDDPKTNCIIVLIPLDTPSTIPRQTYRCELDKYLNVTFEYGINFSFSVYTFQSLLTLGQTKPYTLLFMRKGVVLENVILKDAFFMGNDITTKNVSFISCSYDPSDITRVLGLSSSNTSKDLAKSENIVNIGTMLLTNFIINDMILDQNIPLGEHNNNERCIIENRGTVEGNIIDVKLQHTYKTTSIIRSVENGIVRLDQNTSDAIKFTIESNHNINLVRVDNWTGDACVEVSNLELQIINTSTDKSEIMGPIFKLGLPNLTCVNKQKIMFDIHKCEIIYKSNTDTNILLFDTTHFDIDDTDVKNVNVPSCEEDISRCVNEYYPENCHQSPHIDCNIDLSIVELSRKFIRPITIKKSIKFKEHDLSVSIYYVDASNRNIEIVIPGNPNRGLELTFKRIDKTNNKVHIRTNDGTNIDLHSVLCIKNIIKHNRIVKLGVVRLHFEGQQYYAL